MKSSITLRSILAAGTMALLSACGSGSDLSITKIKPPVKEAAGSGLTASASLLYSSKGEVGILGIGDNIKTNFFSGGGPTDIMTILGSLDGRLTEIETRAGEGEHTCLDATATGVTISVLGESVTAKFQCYEPIGSGLMAFGKDGDTWWVLDSVGATSTLAKTTQTANGTDVEVWGTVGLNNGTPWDGMSYGAYHLKGNSSTRVFEMTSGGIGFGFCGVSLNSDGTNLYISGSEDGANGACQATADACVLSTNLSSAGSCNSLNTFSLTGIGRAAATGTQNWAVSTWPSTTKTIMDGTSSDAIHWVNTSAITSAVGKF